MLNPEADIMDDMIGTQAPDDSMLDDDNDSLFGSNPVPDAQEDNIPENDIQDIDTTNDSTRERITPNFGSLAPMDGQPCVEEPTSPQFDYLESAQMGFTETDIDALEVGNEMAQAVKIEASAINDTTYAKAAAVSNPVFTASDLDAELASFVDEEQDTPLQSIEQDRFQSIVMHAKPDMPAEPDINTQMPDFQEDQLQADATSLFVPERGHTPAITLPIRPISTSLLPADILTHASKQNETNTISFAKIREIQRRLKMSKAAGKRPLSTSNPLLGAALDNDPCINTNPPFRSIQSVKGPNEDAIKNEEFHRLSAEEYNKKKKRYDDLKVPNGSLTFKQEIEWMKIHSAEEARRKKLVRDRQKALEETGGSYEIELFPEIASPMEANAEHNPDLVFELSEQGGLRKRRKTTLPRKEPKRQSLQDAELQSMNVALDAEDDKPKNKKKGSSDADDPEISGQARGRKASRPKPKNPKSSKSKGVRKHTTKGSQKSAKQKREISRRVGQMASLFSADVFRDQAAQDAPDQPIFTQTRVKKDALKELIASVPLEHKKSAKTEMNALMGATRDFDGHGSVKPHGNNMWLVKGMKTSLKGYQLLGSAFMRRREGGEQEPRGGLMADQMGLGKTLMMLANIVNGKPPREATTKTTLLIASPNLLTQWGNEIEQHTNCGLTYLVYGAGNRIKSNRSFQVLKQFDIVLTTYSEVMGSYPKNDPPLTCQTAEEKEAWWRKVYEVERGVLHRIQWHRIVLDEAQAIKNHLGRTSIACRALMADHRWALSGTPILNGLTELYPYFKFLNVPHTGSFKIFKQNYCDTKDSENTERLLVRLSQFMIRRTHADKMFDAPILKLPKADQATHWCEFNPVERSIYDIVHRRFVVRINQMSHTGELENSYSNMLVMLLRLRQLTAHVLMLQFVMQDLLELEDIDEIREVIKDFEGRTANSRTIVALRNQLNFLAKEEKRRSTDKKHKDEEDSSVTEDVAEIEQDEETQGLEASGLRLGRTDAGKVFGTEYDFKPYINSLTVGEGWVKTKQRAICSRCRCVAVDPWVTSCHHIYCLGCYEEAMFAAAGEGREGARCENDECGRTFRHARMCDPEAEPEERYPTRSKAQKKKERPRPDRDDIKEDWLMLGDEGVLPSAKTIAIKAQLLNWITENPNVKIIIYTQFLAMIRILAKVCEGEGWLAEQYHGKLSFPARDKVITNFADNAEVRVLLASLRCGGLGLNLTMASRVIVIDPWWNAAAEQQAFCRVFRIGQKETTFMTRFCVKNTVDQRLIEMQKRKQEEIDEVMEDDGARVKKLGTKDLMRLFGPVMEDGQGKPFIMVDNADPHSGFRADKDDEGYTNDF